MSAPFKDYPADYFQNQLFPSNVFDLLPDDHDCFVYRDLFEQLDTSEVDAQYSRRAVGALILSTTGSLRDQIERGNAELRGSIGKLQEGQAGIRERLVRLDGAGALTLVTLMTCRVRIPIQSAIRVA